MSLPAPIAKCPRCSARVPVNAALAPGEWVLCTSCGGTFTPGRPDRTDALVPPTHLSDVTCAFTAAPRPPRTAQAGPAPSEGVTSSVDETIPGERPPGVDDAERRGGPVPVRLPGYEVQGVLGRGGMGVVYKARDTRLNRLVAIKMIHAGGHAGEAEVARFRTEAEAVARLQHPHIVQIHEVGEHEGLPYLSLEYCAGGPLSRRIDGTPLPPAEAAGLVRTLARAMHAAHQKGVIHRDLKPANVLLTDEGQPKISDFGLAKNVGEAGQTHTGTLLGTPSYMAPEQARGEVSAVDARTDVYALGAVLYELLTGRPPFKATTSVDTVLQVLHQEPLAPSQLQPKVPHDLETICLKCLQKAAAKRYPTAEALADDLERFLKHEPITARPVGRAERAWRWCVRNKAVAGLLAGVAASLLGGAAASVALALYAHQGWTEAEQKAAAAVASERRALVKEQEAQASALEAAENAREARESARRAAARQREADQIARFMVGMFDAADPIGMTGYAFGADPDQGATLTAKAILDRGASKVTQELKDQPETRAALLTTIGSVYRTMGLYKESRPLLEEGLRLRREQHAGASPELARSWFELGWLRHLQGEDAEAIQCYHKAVEVAGGTAAGVEIASRARFNTAWLLAQQWEGREAEKLFRDVLEERRARLGDDHLEVAVARTGLASVLFQSGRALEALPHVNSAMATYRKKYGEDSFAVAVGHGQSALLAASFGQYATAEENLLKAAGLIQKKLGDNHPYVAWVYGLLGELMQKANRADRAEEYYARCLQIGRDGTALEHPIAMRAVRPYAHLLAGAGRVDEACKVFEEVAERQRQLRGPSHPLVALTLGDYAAFARAYKRTAEAERHYRQCLEIVRAAPPGSLPWAWEHLNGLAILIERRNPAEAETLYREAIAARRRRKTSVDDDQLAVLYLNCVNLLMRQKRHAEADALVREGLGLITTPATTPKGRNANELVALASRLPPLVRQELRLHAGGLALLASPHGVGPLAAASAVTAGSLTRSLDPAKAVFRRQGQLTTADPLDRVQRKSHHHSHNVPMQAGRLYRIDLTSREFDTYLRVEDASGKQLACNDDISDEDLNSRISFRASQGGSYRLVVTTYQAGSTGAYILTVSDLSAEPTPTQEVFRRADRLTAKDGPDPTLAQSYQKVFPLKLEAGTAYTIELGSKEFDAFLRVEEAPGQVLASDDDGGGGLDARLVFCPSRTATYRVVVTSYKAGETGQFTLKVRR